ncbi:MAG TPA: hypothetical protein VLY63_16025 [Anaerolineae bacterium]|nr:hypothetical protein [Anaerolineae bacterium]
MVGLIYGSGTRLMECLRLRVKDLEFGRRALIVRDGKEGAEKFKQCQQRIARALAFDLTKPGRCGINATQERRPTTVGDDRCLMEMPKRAASLVRHDDYPINWVQYHGRELAVVGRIPE